MKKIMLVLLVILFCVMLIDVSVNAEDFESTNYIKPDDLTVSISDNNGYAQITITGKSGFRIKQGVEYFILPTYINKQEFDGFSWFDLPLFQNGDNSNSLSIYEGIDAKGEPIDDYRLTKRLYSNGILVGYAFTFDDITNSSKVFKLTLKSNTMSIQVFNQFYDEYIQTIDCGLLIIEADNLKNIPTSTFNYEMVRGSPSYDISDLYLGEDITAYRYGVKYQDELSPVINTNQYEYTTRVDNPITIESLMSELSLTAYDEVDGDISENITYVAEVYQERVLLKVNVKERVLGTYAITFSVSDYSSNTSSCIINIIVIDDTKPYLDISNSIFEYIREVDGPSIDMDQILTGLLVSDNYSDVCGNIVANNYLGNEGVLGRYQITVEYVDESNNKINVSVFIRNVDNTAPTINCPNSLYLVSYQDNKSTGAILNELQIEVLDNYDANIIYEIEQNQYLGNETKVGLYYIDLSAADSSGNQSELRLTIKVIDDVDPQFYLNSTKVIIISGEILKLDDLKEILISRKLVKFEQFKIEIVSDNYTMNETTIGEYEMKLKITYENKETDYQKIEINVTAKDVKQVSFWQKVWNIIKKILQTIWNIIKWPFVKLFSLF
jgi:hypothetical protein